MGYYLGKNTGVSDEVRRIFDESQPANFNTGINSGWGLGAATQGARPPDPDNPPGGGTPSPSPGGAVDPTACIAKCQATYDAADKSTLMAQKAAKAALDACTLGCKKARDVPPGTGGDQIAACKAKCDTSYNALIAKGASPEVAAQARDACYAKCSSTGSGPPGTGSKPGDGDPWEGCARGKKYMANSQSECEAGYIFIPKNNNAGYQGQCECQKWCQDIGYSSDCKTYVGGATGQTGGQMGEFNWSPELDALMKNLVSRGQTMLGTKPGFGQAAIEAMFGKNFDEIRAGENASRQYLQDQLQSEGLWGTGTAGKALRESSWKTETNVANVQRDLFLANEAQKRNDLQSFTQAAQNMAMAGMSFEQIREAINAGRRGEGRESLALWLQYILGLAGSWS